MKTIRKLKRYNGCYLNTLNNIRVKNIGYICNANINKATLELLFEIANKPQRNDSMRRVLSNWINDHTE